MLVESKRASNSLFTVTNSRFAVYESLRVAVYNCLAICLNFVPKSWQSALNTS